MSVISNIARHLPLMAQAHPELCAIKIPRGRTPSGDINYLALSFTELEQEVRAWQKKLSAAGIRRGDRTLVMVRAGLPLIASVFALFSLGAVPVVIDSGMGLKSFLACVRRSQPRALVGIPLACCLSWVARKSFSSLQVRVWANSKLDAQLGKPDETRSERLAIEATRLDELAAILFTSGSTGIPKGVCYEHGMFEAQVAQIRELYEIKPGEVNLPLLSIFALFNPAFGMTTIVPELDPRHPARIDPSKIVQAIRQEHVSNSFGSPTLWRIIGDHCIKNKIDLPALRLVLCAGAPVPASLWRDAPRFLSKGEMHSPYGATEALPVSSVGGHEIALDSMLGAHVGKPVPRVEVRVIRIEDGPLERIEDSVTMPAGQIGEIIVKGPMVTRHYDRLPEADREAKIADADGFWHRMGDAGFLDGSGGLWFCGRKAERVETGEGPVFTEPVERVFRQHPRARRCALVGLGDNGAKTPALIVETRIRDSKEARELAHELRLLGQTQPQSERVTIFFFRDHFPVDVRHNAKIHRLELAQWAGSAVGYQSDPKR
jgi:acyl-CoA synthetase (AMP-forming)/AMP-acid ligase II